jgi:hypothetical protein
VAGEASAGSTTPQEPSANHVSPYWIRYEGRTFMNKGYQPMQNILADMAKYVPLGDANFARWNGDKADWPFDTECCATDQYRRMASCDPIKAGLLFA